MVVCVCVYRLSEQSRLVAEQKRLVSELRGKFEDAQQWNYKYKVSQPTHRYWISTCESADSGSIYMYTSTAQHSTVCLSKYLLVQ